MFVPCFVVQCFISFLVLVMMGKRESWLLYFVCLPAVLWLSLFCGSSSRCMGWSAVCDCGIS